MTTRTRFLTIPGELRQRRTLRSPGFAPPQPSRDCKSRQTKEHVDEAIVTPLLTVVALAIGLGITGPQPRRKRPTANGLVT